MSLERVVDLLACPHGEPELRLRNGGLVCDAGHRFDVARHGYANLLDGPAPAAADTAGMVAARAGYEAAGHHDRLTDALVDAVCSAVGDGEVAGPVLDVGAGTGRHLAGVLDATGAPAGLAIDISKHAARRAARAHARIGAIVADVWRGLPVRDGAAEIVLDVFAPRDAGTFARILRPGGWLIVATPEPGHLAPLVDELGLLAVAPDKARDLDVQLAAGFSHVATQQLRSTARLDRAAAERVVAMGPNAHHLDAERLAGRLDTLTFPMEVTQAVRVATYQRR